MDAFMDVPAFSKLTFLAVNDKRIMRAITQLVEGSHYPADIQASAYSVALETMKNVITEQHVDKINPFKSREIARRTVEGLVALIEPMNDSNFNDKKTVLNKLRQLNQVTNKDALKMAFKLSGFELNAHDEEALAKRNDFLHGRLPYEDLPDFDDQLRFVNLKMHFLVSVLILKYAGFKGWIKNTPVFIAAIKQSTKQVDEPAFRK